MKKIEPSNNMCQWPRKEVKSVECRKIDLVVRISNWMHDKEEPAYDVEVYIGGVYDWDESKSFTLFEHKTEEKAKQRAIEFAQVQVTKLL